VSADLDAALAEEETISTALVEALKGLADFDPNDSRNEGWDGGWCFCGGSTRHEPACVAARKVLERFTRHRAKNGTVK
jgi:hypothetical protein